MLVTNVLCGSRNARNMSGRGATEGRTGLDGNGGPGVAIDASGSTTRTDPRSGVFSPGKRERHATTAVNTIAIATSHRTGDVTGCC